MTRKILIILSALALVGCASDPLMTGEPHDWVGHLASDLKAAMGEPTRVIHQSNYQDNDPAIAKLFEGKSGKSEIWEYVQTGDAISPKESDTKFRFGGFGGSTTTANSYGNTAVSNTHGGFGGGGGIKTTESPEHMSHFVNLTRFEVRNGIIVKWFQSRTVDGLVLWTHH
jgi:hypothetical protein